MSREIKKIGTKNDVFKGFAEKTSGGLMKGDLMINKRGKVVSKKKSEAGKKAFDNIKEHVKTAKELAELKKEKKLKQEDISKKDEIIKNLPDKIIENKSKKPRVSRKKIESEENKLQLNQDNNNLSQEIPVLSKSKSKSNILKEVVQEEKL